MRLILYYYCTTAISKKAHKELLGDHYSIRIPSPRLHIQMIRKIPIAVEKILQSGLQICMQINIWEDTDTLYYNALLSFDAFKVCLQKQL